MVDTPQGYIGATSSKVKVTTAMIFDYDAIVEKYGIDIDIITESSDTQEEQEDKHPEPPTPTIKFPQDE